MSAPDPLALTEAARHRNAVQHAMPRTDNTVPSGPWKQRELRDQYRQNRLTNRLYLESRGTEIGWYRTCSSASQPPSPTPGTLHTAYSPMPSGPISRQITPCTPSLSTSMHALLVPRSTHAKANPHRTSAETSHRLGGAPPAKCGQLSCRADRSPAQPSARRLLPRPLERRAQPLRYK